jgi:RsmE family RNA methyltransferase
VNLVLITADEAKIGLPPDDARARHLRETVGLAVGGTFHVGIENGLRGIATITTLAPQLTFAVAWEKSPQARLPLTVLVGLPRPQTAKKVLHDLASLGAARIVFFESAKGDPGYLTSSLWKDGEWREHVLKGAEQACSTLVPEVTRVSSLGEALVGLEANTWKLALDPYEAPGAPEISAPAKAAVLAIGPERGFADEEREALRAAGFAFAHLGDRILRVEAAALVGGALMLAQLRVWEKHQSLGG